MGFIQKGVCHVLRKVDVLRKNEDGKDIPQMKQVVIGKLKENESFGELSVILKEPMTCSIVTETECKIGVIQYEKIFSMLLLTL
jgi:CRP-like cAMP-binding protein